MIDVMKRFLLPFFLILLVFLLFASFFWFYEAKYFIGRASVSQASISVDNSYVFVSPLRAKANNQERIRVTIFVLNNQGLGVMAKKARLTNDQKLSVETIQGLTDDHGKAVFDVSSGTPGEYYLEVMVEGTSLSQKAHLSYY